MSEIIRFNGPGPYSQFAIRDLHSDPEESPVWATGLELIVASQSTILVSCRDPLFGDIEVVVYLDQIGRSDNSMTEFAHTELALHSGWVVVETVDTVGRSPSQHIGPAPAGDYKVVIYGDRFPYEDKRPSRFWILLFGQ